MDNLVVLYTGHALDLRGVLLRLIGLLGLLRLLQVLDNIRQLYGLSLTHLELLIPLMQLVLEVVDVALGGGQLVMSMLQPSVGVVKEVGLEVTSAISPHQFMV
jgi:hypothetical protein